MTLLLNQNSYFHFLKYLSVNIDYRLFLMINSIWGGTGIRGPNSATGATLTIKFDPHKGRARSPQKPPPGRKLSAKIKLQFTPKKGARLTTTTTVAVG